MLHISN